jgi:hypothetical protein
MENGGVYNPDSFKDKYGTEVAYNSRVPYSWAGKKLENRLYPTVELLAGKFRRQGWAGISLNLDSYTIASVEANSPAEKAGLKSGDVIFLTIGGVISGKINGEIIGNNVDIPNYISSKYEGDIISMLVVNNGVGFSRPVSLQLAANPNNVALLEGRASVPVIIPENDEEYVIYYLAESNYNLKKSRAYTTTTENPFYNMFADYINSMVRPAEFSIEYFDADGFTIRKQTFKRPAPLPTVYRSFYSIAPNDSSDKFAILEAFALAPGFVSGAKDIFLDSSTHPLTYNVELDEEDLQRVDSMKFEVIFED